MEQKTADRNRHLAEEGLELLFPPLLLPVALIPLGSEIVEVDLHQVLRFALLLVIAFRCQRGLGILLMPVSPRQLTLVNLQRWRSGEQQSDGQHAPREREARERRAPEYGGRIWPMCQEPASQ